MNSSSRLSVKLEVFLAGRVEEIDRVKRKASYRERLPRPLKPPSLPPTKAETNCIRPPVVRSLSFLFLVDSRMIPFSLGRCVNGGWLISAAPWRYGLEEEELAGPSGL